MTQVRSAKSVRSSTTSDFQATTQGNVSNARSNVRKHHTRRSLQSVGGTSNNVRAMFGLDGKTMCKVVTSVHSVDVGPAHSNTYRGYNANTPGARRSDSTVQHTGTSVTGMSWDYIVRKCAKLDISLVEYCDMYNFPLSAIANLSPKE